MTLTVLACHVHPPFRSPSIYVHPMCSNLIIVPGLIVHPWSNLQAGIDFLVTSALVLVYELKFLRVEQNAEVENYRVFQSF